jgi:hypothetical protein
MLPERRCANQSLMSGSHEDSDPKNLPVPFTGRPEVDIQHHRKEWTSGTRGGGKIPKDFSWPTNPKQQQEEYGSGEAEKPISK